MLRVTVELVPFGDESKKKKIGEMVLANDTRGYGDNASYEGWIAPDEWCGDPQMFGKVDRYDRRGNVWTLIMLMIEQCMPKHIPSRGKDDLSQRLKAKLGFKFPKEKGILCGPAKKTKAQIARDVEDTIRRITFSDDIPMGKRKKER